MKVNLKLLCKSCKYDPEKIGIAILKAQGYKVKTFMISPDVYVRDKKTDEIVFAKIY